MPHIRGNEGGGPRIRNNMVLGNVLCQHTHTPCVCRVSPPPQVKIGMDVAASEFQTEDKMYDLKFKEKDNDGSGKKTG